MFFLLLASSFSKDGRFDWVDLVALLVIGIIVLVMWFAFRDLEKLSSEKDDDKKN